MEFEYDLLDAVESGSLLWVLHFESKENYDTETYLQGLYKASEIGNLEIFDYLFEKIKKREDNYNYKINFCFRNIEFVKKQLHIEPITSEICNKILLDAARFNDVECARLALSLGATNLETAFKCCCNYDSIEVANLLPACPSSFKSLKMFNYLLSRGVKADNHKAILVGLKNGEFNNNVSQLLELLETIDDVDKYGLIEHHSTFSSFTIFKLIDKIVPKDKWRTDSRFEEACGICDVDKIMYLNKIDKTQLNNGLLKAAKAGHYIIVKLLVESGANNLASAFQLAVANGHLDIVEYFLDKDVSPENFKESDLRNLTVEMAKYILTKVELNEPLKVKFKTTLIK